MGDQTRFVTYVCYCPRSLMSPAELAKKVEVFKGRKGTTHFPVSFIPVISGWVASVTRLDEDGLTYGISPAVLESYSSRASRLPQRSSSST